MEINSNFWIIIGASFTLFLIIVIGCIWMICKRRKRSSSSTAGYDELDQEEIEFKRMIESHGNSNNEEEDDTDDLFSSGMEDISFNAKDKDRLSMLENLRNNLVAGAEKSDLNNESQSDIDVREGEEDLRL